MKRTEAEIVANLKEIPESESDQNPGLGLFKQSSRKTSSTGNSLAGLSLIRDRGQNPRSQHVKSSPLHGSWTSPDEVEIKGESSVVINDDKGDEFTFTALVLNSGSVRHLTVVPTK